MLVLSRRVGQRIVAPAFDLTITVLEIRGNRVRLGIAAPDGVVVHRDEVWRHITETPTDAPVSK